MIDRILTADALYQEFLALIPDAITRLDVQGGDDVWTRWVKDCFDILGQRKGYEVRRTDRAKQQSEFMLDLCWFEETATKYGMQLALECEWNDFKDDFKKLLHVRAPVKVFVFAWSEPENKLAQMRKWLGKYSFKSLAEQYLVINLPDSNKDVIRELTFTGDFLSSSGQTQALGQKTFPI